MRRAIPDRVEICQQCIAEVIERIEDSLVNLPKRTSDRMRNNLRTSLNLLYGLREGNRRYLNSRRHEV